MSYVLKYTNPYGERFYLCNLGDFWRANDTRRLIERTTPKETEARVFGTEEEALETLVVAGSPAGYEVVESRP